MAEIAAGRFKADRLESADTVEKVGRRLAWTIFVEIGKTRIEQYQ